MSGRLLKPFHLERRVVAPAKLTNSPRLESLVRGGNLYLSVQDVIALALENNLDIAVQRYSPFLAREVLRRAEGGGFLRQVDTPVAAGPDLCEHGGNQHQRERTGRRRRIGRRRRNRQPDRAGASQPGSQPVSERQRGPQHHAADQHPAESDDGVDARLPAVRVSVFAAIQYGDQRELSRSSTRAACSTVPRRSSTPRSADTSTCRSTRTCCKA